MTIRFEMTPEDVTLLRRHVINLRMGAFSSGGRFQTTREDVEALFAEHLPRFLESASAGIPTQAGPRVLRARRALNEESRA